MAIGKKASASVKAATSNAGYKEPKFKEVDPYKSQYGGQINNLINAAVNRQEFSYDPNTDPAYQSYAKEYGRLGDRARQNTLGDFAANTGGYASTAAVSAAQQAQNDYNQQLSMLVPQLMQAAYERYQGDFNMNMATLGALTDRDNDMYARWNDNRNYNRDKFVEDRTFGYGKYRDTVGDKQWAKQFALDQLTANRNYRLDKAAQGLSERKFKWEKSQGSSGSGGGSGRSGGSSGRSSGGGSGSGNGSGYYYDDEGNVYDADGNLIEQANEYRNPGGENGPLADAASVDATFLIGQKWAHMTSDEQKKKFKEQREKALNFFKKGKKK